MLTTYIKDGEYETSLFNIVMNYAVKGPMIFDLAAVIPTLITHSSQATYGFKIIRFLKLSQVYESISNMNRSILIQLGLTK